MHQNIRFGVPSFLLANFFYKDNPTLTLTSVDCPSILKVWIPQGKRKYLLLQKKARSPFFKGFGTFFCEVLKFTRQHKTLIFCVVCSELHFERKKVLSLPRKQRIIFHKFIHFGANFCNYSFVIKVVKDAFDQLSNFYHKIYFGTTSGDSSSTKTYS